MRKLAQVREQAILSLNKIRRVRLTSLGVAQLRLQTEANKIKRESKFKMKQYYFAKLLSRYFRTWIKHHQLPEFSLRRKAANQRKYTLLKKYLGGFHKLTLHKRNKRILWTLKSDRLKQDIYFAWKREVSDEKINRLKVREVRRNRLKKVLYGWSRCVDQQQTI